MAINIPIFSSLDTKGFDKAKKEFDSLEGAGAKSAFALKKAMLPAVAAVGAIGAGLVLATKAAMEDQKSQELLALALENTTGGTLGGAAALEKQISAMSKSAAVADDVLRPAMGNLLRGTRDVERAQELMAVALDVSAATGKDLESVTIALSKAENGQLDALKKLGIPLGENTILLKEKTKLTKEVTKFTQDLAGIEYDLTNGFIDGAKAAEKTLAVNEKLAATNAELADVTARAGDFTLDLSNQFGGAAATAANSFQGQMAGLKIAMDETKESIGAALLPALKALLGILKPVADFAQENTKLFLIMIGVIGGLATAIIAINVAMKIYEAVLALTALRTAALNLVTTANPYVIMAAAIVALTAVMVVLEVKFQSISKAMEKFGNGIMVVTGPLGVLIGMLRKLDNLRESLGGFDLGGINIPGFAKGGIVTRPTLAMIGEAGPEAVVPLSGPNAGNFGGGGVTVNVTGGLATSSEIGQAIVNAIRAYNRSAGPANIQVA
jgi:hypothetical protein